MRNQCDGCLCGLPLTDGIHQEPTGMGQSCTAAKYGCGPGQLHSSCSNPRECSTSSGICGALTFGSGELDHMGYWEFPCTFCKALHDHTMGHTEQNPCMCGA